MDIKGARVGEMSGRGVLSGHGQRYACKKTIALFDELVFNKCGMNSVNFSVWMKEEDEGTEEVSKCVKR